MTRHRQSEGVLKAWLLNRLIEQGRIDRNTVLANEFSLPSEEIRADLALLGDEFIGVEIKSPLDSLRRLARQVQAYGRIFDRTILVCSSAHIVRVIGRVPSVELWEVTKDYRLVVHHSPTLLSELPAGRRLALVRATSRNIEPFVRFEVDPREELLKTFRGKFTQPSHRFWANVSKRGPTAEDLQILSRFAHQRNMHREVRANRDAFWDTWQQQALHYFS